MPQVSNNLNPASIEKSVEKSFIKALLKFIIFALLLIAFFVLLGSCVKDARFTDLDGDGLRDLIFIYGSPFAELGRGVAVINGFSLYINEALFVGPKRLVIGEVLESQGRVIGVLDCRRVIFHPVAVDRPLLFNYKDKKLSRRLLISRLQQPVIDFRLVDILDNGVNEIVALEGRQGEMHVRVYEEVTMNFEMIAAYDYDEIGDKVIAEIKSDLVGLETRARHLKRIRESGDQEGVANGGGDDNGYDSGDVNGGDAGEVGGEVSGGDAGESAAESSAEDIN